MAPDIQVTETTRADLVEIDPLLRQADRAELIAGTLLSPLACMELTLEHAAEAWTGRANGEIGCIFGLTEPSIIYLGQGTPWMFSTHLLERYPMAFLRASKEVVAAMLEDYPYLENFVDARNVVSIRWLRWLGFTIEEAQPYGLLNRPFHRFHMGSS